LSSELKSSVGMMLCDGTAPGANLNIHWRPCVRPLVEVGLEFNCTWRTSVMSVRWCHITDGWWTPICHHWTSVRKIDERGMSKVQQIPIGVSLL
jgi:hypothetical protein